MASATVTLPTAARTDEGSAWPKNPTLTGSVVPARAGVKVNLDVRKGSSYRYTAQTTTDAAGRFQVRFGYGKGNLASYTVRTTYKAANRDRWERSGTRTVKRVAVLNAVVADTTAADVAKTWRRPIRSARSPPTLGSM